MEVCFLSSQPRFPEHEKDSIDTIQFLEAARGLVRLVGKSYLYSISSKLPYNV